VTGGWWKKGEDCSSYGSLAAAGRTGCLQGYPSPPAPHSVVTGITDIIEDHCDNLGARKAHERPLVYDQSLVEYVVVDAVPMTSSRMRVL